MECKCGWYAASIWSFVELIDTLWNVNHSDKVIKDIEYSN